MYPSVANVRYGIFVKRFEEQLNEDFDIHKIVLTKHYNLFSKLMGYIRLYLKVFLLYFKAKKKDIIYIHFPLYFSVLIIPLVLLNYKVVLNFHGSDAVFNSVLKKMLAFFLYPVVKHTTVVVPSEYYKTIVSQVFNLSNSVPILVYPSGGINKNLFYPIEKKHKNFTLGFISNFIESKGWRIFLDAVTELKKSKSILDFDIVMVGDGPDKHKIDENIKNRSLEVTMIPSVDQKELVNVYGKLDLFIFPTFRKEESLGLVGLEAMMCGIPVVASKTGGPMGYIKEGVNGYLFEKKDIQGLKNAILRFYTLNANEKRIMKKKCVETAMDYESTKVSHRMITLLNNL